MMPLLVTIKRRLLPCLALFLVMTVFVDSAGAQSLSFSQMDFDFGNGVYSDTEWGNVDVTFTGETGVSYLNLAVNGRWEIQNMPVYAFDGVGVSSTLSMYFDLGLARGTSVSSLNYDFLLTSAFQSSMPGGSNIASVSKGMERILDGLRDSTGGILQAPGAPVIGSQLLSIATGRSFPNQEAGVNECVPASVSNSLNYLNSKWNMNLNGSDITIAKMKIATKWASDGAWTYHTSSHNAWWEDKDAYMKANNLPITTRQITLGNTPTSRITAMRQLIKEKNDGQDVEILWDGHAVALVGIAEMLDGDFKLYVNHDRKQGVDGGCVTEPVEFDPNTGKVIRSHRTDQNLLYAVVECPVPEPSSLILMLSGGVICLAVLRRRTRQAEHKRVRSTDQAEHKSGT